MPQHKYYRAHTEWSSAEGTGVYAYDRTHTIAIEGKPGLVLTTGNPLRGDAAKLNPEDLLLAAVSSCHMLSYLYLCSVNGVSVISYTDNAVCTQTETAPGKSVITAVELNPVMVLASKEMKETALELHHQAHEICIIANSVNFDVRCNPVCKLR